MKHRTKTDWLTKGGSDDTPDLFVAFAGGVALAAIAWLILHLGTSSVDFSRSVDMLWPVDSEAVYSVGNGQTAGEVKGNGINRGTESHGVSSSAEDAEPINIRVYLTKNKTIETVPLETYVRGVVAAEMPLDFEPAALEAQALAVRTYILRRLWLNDRSSVPVEGADVTDTQTHQVYRSLTDMKHLSLTNEQGWRKINDAVKNTAGQVITYGGQPIEALFFSTSNGYTENSEEVFPAKLPYLRSVISPWDKQGSPRAEETVEMPLSVFYEKLGVESIDARAGSSRQQPMTRVLERTEGHRVKLLAAGAVRLSGEEVREKLGLRSAAFEWQMNKDKITLTVYGSGHGVGMSQWGAQGMAKAGNSAQQIVQHYYTGARIDKVSNLLKRSGKRL